MCSNQAGGGFLDYSATFVIRQHMCSNQAGGSIWIYETQIIKGSMA